MSERHTEEYIKHLQQQLTEKDKEIISLSSNLSARNKAVLEKDAVIEKYEEIIQCCYDACLCERFETKGFDYHERHPRFGNNGGTRKKTPRVLIEDWVGYKWKYSKVEGVCPSWKELKFKKYTGHIKEGFDDEPKKVLAETEGKE